MTDEELGRKWCEANGKSPKPGPRAWTGGQLWWGHANLPDVMGLQIPCGYEDEAEAYADVGRQLRKLWAFAEESRRQAEDTTTTQQEN